MSHSGIICFYRHRVSVNNCIHKLYIYEYTEQHLPLSYHSLIDADIYIGNGNMKKPNPEETNSNKPDNWKFFY